jgi:hypothetical protein
MPTITVPPGPGLPAAINAAGENGEIVLQSGFYPIPGELRLKQGQTIRGATKLDKVVGDSSLIEPLSGYALRVETSGVTIKNLSIAGHGILAALDAKVERLTVDNVSIRVEKPSHEKNSGIEWGGHGIWNSAITNCYINGTAAINHLIYGYRAVGCKFANIDFIGGGDGIHVIYPSTSTEAAPIVEQCYFKLQRRMFVEYQGGGTGFRLLDCWGENPLFVMTTVPPGTRPNPNDSILGFSLPATEASDVLAEGNVVISQERPNEGGVSIGQRCGFEFASLGGFVCRRNLVIGTSMPVTVTNPGAKGDISLNHFEQFLKQSGPNNGGKVFIGTNVSDSLKRELLARGKPGPNRRFGQTPPPPPPPPPPPDDPPIVKPVVRVIVPSSVEVKVEVLP